MNNTLPLDLVVRFGARVLGFALALLWLPVLVLSAAPSLSDLDQPLG